MRTPRRRLAKLVPALALIALALPASASAQASRTWVSGVGDDANPCSRTAPCKTFPGAISKTASGGEINCLDPGGFGGVTITKAITIKCQYTEGGVLVSGTNAIVVNAAATDKVVLKGLDINGFGTGLNGIRILQAQSGRGLDSEIYRVVRVGIHVRPKNSRTNPGSGHRHSHERRRLLVQEQLPRQQRDKRDLQGHREPLAALPAGAQALPLIQPDLESASVG